MENNNFNGLGDFLKGINSVQEKLDRSIKPFKGIEDVAGRFDKHLAGVTFNPAVWYNQKNNNYPFDAIFGSSLNINRLVEDIYRNQKPDFSQIVFGGSTVSNLAKYIENSIPSKVNAIESLVMGIQDKFGKYDSLLDKQLTVTDQLTRLYLKTNYLPEPSWIDKITQIPKAFDPAKPTMFDILSAHTLTQIAKEIEENNEVIDGEEELTSVSDLIAENQELKLKLEHFFTSYAKRIAKRLQKKKRVRVKDTKESQNWLAEVIHVLLKEKVSLISIILFIKVLSLSLDTIKEIYIERHGADIWDSWTGYDPNAKSQRFVASKINSSKQYPIFKSDFVIEKTGLYLRSSLKTKRLGMIPKGTTLIVLNEKNKWCFVEVLIHRYDKKLKCELKKVMRGWILREYLESQS